MKIYNFERSRLKHKSRRVKPAKVYCKGLFEQYKVTNKNIYILRPSVKYCTEYFRLLSGQKTWW